MLAELQRLQTLINTLTRQLQQARLENSALAQQVPSVDVNMMTEELNKNNEQRQKLQQELVKAIDQRQQVQNELGALTGRYESLALANQTMSTEMERLANELAQHALLNRQLSSERDALLHKNKEGKRKAEAIIQKLMGLGGEQRPHSATPAVASAEVTPVSSSELANTPATPSEFSA